MSAFSRSWIPNQHGAWAMLITPVLVGALAAGPTAWHLLLLLTWLAAYCLNFFLQQTLKRRRWGRHDRQILVYGSLTALFGLPLAWRAPDLLALLVLALPAFALNVFFVLRRNERAWLNDVVGILLAGVVGYGAVLLGGRPLTDASERHATLALVVVSAYFIGTVLYVKTLIRERGSLLWLRLSHGYHGLLVLALLATGQWTLALIAAALLARAWYVPRVGWTPKRVGMVEIASTTAVAVGALLTLP